MAATKPKVVVTRKPPAPVEACARRLAKGRRPPDRVFAAML